jgi:O-methyltransferase
MRLRRRLANFLLKRCGLRRLHDGRLQRFLLAVLSELDLQYVRDSNPCRSVVDRSEMFSFVQQSCIGTAAVDYLEFGVFQGDSIRQWIELNKNRESRFFGFDSFEGLPEDWRSGQAKGHFDVGGTVPAIDDARVKWIKGWFEETIPPFAREFSTRGRLLLHIDSDLYSSAMLALMHFGPFMSKGTLLIFDEFYDREHEFKALMDWRRIYNRDFRVVAQVDNYGKVCLELV